jgi:hypothetical protein
MLDKSLQSGAWREKHSAASVLLSYGFGKPVQPIVGEDGGSLTLLHLVAVKATGERIIAELTAPRTVIDGRANGDGDGVTIEAVPASLTDLSAPATE